MLLTAAGGFLDAFSYVGQGHVFANVMTGNLVLSAISSVRGDWTHVARLLLPLASYVVGASAGAMLRSTAQKRMIASAPGPGSRGRDRNPGRNRLVARGVLQRGHRLGDLLPDRGQELLLFARGGVDLRVNHADRQSAAIRRGRVPVGVGDGQPEVETASSSVFALVTLSFFLGALAGGVTTDILHNRAVWIGGLFLLAALVCGLVDRPPALSTVASSVCVIGILALLSVTSARAQTLQDAAPVCPGPSTTLPVTTYDEDVKYLANPECQAGVLAPVQFIPLRGEDRELLPVVRILDSRARRLRQQPKLVKQTERKCISDAAIFGAYGSASWGTFPLLR